MNLRASLQSKQFHGAKIVARSWAVGRERHHQAASYAKHIEEISVGDLVWAWDEQTGKRVKRSVRRLFRRKSREVLRVLLCSDSGGDKSQSITTTTEHPFWVDGQWVAADKLKAGDVLKSISSKKAPYILKIDSQGKSLDVFNFEVDGMNNYFVGRDGLLVHNESTLDNEVDVMAETLRPDQLPQPQVWPDLGYDDAVHFGPGDVLYTNSRADVDDYLVRSFGPEAPFILGSFPPHPAIAKLGRVPAVMYSDRIFVVDQTGGAWYSSSGQALKDGPFYGKHPGDWIAVHGVVEVDELIELPSGAKFPMSEGYIMKQIFDGKGRVTPSVVAPNENLRGMNLALQLGREMNSRQVNDFIELQGGHPRRTMSGRSVGAADEDPVFIWPEGTE
jgi:hypothetical protein